MKHLKLAGLLLVAVMAVIGIGGAGTASATVLCKATETPCSELNVIKKGAEVHADLEGRSVFNLTLGYIFESCTGGTLAATLSGQGGAAATVTVATAASSWTWTGCEGGGVSATQSGELEIHHIAGTDNGTLTGKGFGFKFTSLGSECIYVPASPGHLGLVTGGALPKIHINTVFIESKENLACTPDFVWKATYKITKPALFYVRAS
jgi:hypothetical protein